MNLFSSRFHTGAAASAAAIAALLLCLPTLATADVRIAWDYRSRQIFGEFTRADGSPVQQHHYPRIRQLRSGDLLLVYMDGKFGWQIFQQRSRDGGKTWSDPQWVKRSWYDPVTKDKVAYCNPELLELKDGTLLMAYQRRNNKRSDATEGIEVMRSTDEGQTWSEPIWAYRGKNWEPSMILLPSGEIQLLFTDPLPAPGIGCNVGLVRSFDSGKTWHPTPNGENPQAEYLSRTERTTTEGKPFSMDGMAVGTVLQNGKGIAYAIECSEGGRKLDSPPITPSIVWSAFGRNWHYPDFAAPATGPADRRWAVHPDLHGYAPYLIQLSTGETVVQANGRLKGTGGMWTLIGDDRAHNFGHISRPYGSLGGWWGSIAEIKGGRVLSTANFGAGKGKSNLILVSGILNYPLTSTNSWFIGDTSQAQGRLTASASTTGLTLHFAASDTTVTGDDGFRLSWQHPGDPRTFRLTATSSGAVHLESRRGAAVPWTPLTGAMPKIVAHPRAGKDGGYNIAVTLPWRTLGGRPAKLQNWPAHLELLNSDKAGEAATADGMPGEDPADPSTWLPIRVR